jgi:hypothetical protein
MMRRAILLFILILQAACSPKGSSAVSLPAAPAGPVNSTQSPPQPEQIQAKAWVDDPTPSTNSRIVVRGSLIKYGSYYVGGIMMSGFWADETIERGMPNCFTLVTYGTGKCVIDVSRFPPGEFVPVTVAFDYGGKNYTAQTGFTPQAP